MQQVQTRSNVIWPVVGLVVGVILIILAQFFLDSLADTSDTWHWVQHGTIFVGGLAIGYAVTMLYVRGQGAAA